MSKDKTSPKRLSGSQKVALIHAHENKTSLRSPCLCHRIRCILIHVVKNKTSSRSQSQVSQDRLLTMACTEKHMNLSEGALKHVSIEKPLL